MPGLSKWCSGVKRGRRRANDHKVVLEPAAEVAFLNVTRHLSVAVKETVALRLFRSPFSTKPIKATFGVPGNVPDPVPSRSTVTTQLK
jgi:hypothetical protein